MSAAHKYSDVPVPGKQTLSALMAQREAIGSEIMFMLRCANAPDNKQAEAWRAYWHCIEHWTEHEWYQATLISVDDVLYAILNKYRSCYER